MPGTHASATFIRAVDDASFSGKLMRLSRVARMQLPKIPKSSGTPEMVRFFCGKYFKERQKSCDCREGHLDILIEVDAK